MQTWKHKFSDRKSDSPTVFQECIQSRRHEQWYNMPGPVTEFTINIIFLIIASTATIYHILRGNISRYYKFNDYIIFCF